MWKTHLYCTMELCKYVKGHLLWHGKSTIYISQIPSSNPAEPNPGAHFLPLCCQVGISGASHHSEAPQWFESDGPLWKLLPQVDVLLDSPHQLLPVCDCCGTLPKPGQDIRLCIIAHCPSHYKIFCPEQENISLTSFI